MQRNNFTAMQLNYTEGALRGLLCDMIEPNVANTSLKCVWRWRPPASRGRP